MKILYTAEATTRSGRAGHSETSDGMLKLDLALPKEMGGTGKGTNPEQLFAIGYSACFGSAIDYVSKKHKKPLSDIQVTARVSLGPRQDDGFQLEVTLTIKLPGVPHEEAVALVAEADKVCPYSHSIRGNVDVKINVID